MRASAIAVPLLLFGGFLLFAAGHVFVASAPVISAFIIFLAFPFYLPDRLDQQRTANDTDVGVLRWIWGAARYAILFWFVWQPEIYSFLRRITEGDALWDWRLIVPVGVLAIYFCVSGLRQASFVTDQAIYAYFTGGDGGGLSTSTRG